LGERGFTVDSSSKLDWFKGYSEVVSPIVFFGFKSNFVRVSTKTTFSLHTCVEIEFVSIVLLNTIIIVDFIVLVFKSKVESVSVSEGEPEFEFLIILADSSFLGDLERFLESNCGGSGFFGKFEGEFIGNEVIIEDRVGTFIKLSPRLGFEWICFGHLK